MRRVQRLAFDLADRMGWKVIRMNCCILTGLLMLLAGCRKNDPFSPAGGGVDTTPEVWVSMGQSQMSGEGAGPFPPHPSIVMYQNAPPMGMGYAFAIERAKLGHPVTLIQCAVGGTPMSVWTSGGYLYEACIDKIIASELIVTGFVFDQG